eukprot:SAG31_NODE_27676_length_422_cov_0.795666_1_plen_81_part_00
MLLISYLTCRSLLPRFRLQVQTSESVERLKTKLCQMEESMWEDSEGLSHRLRKVEARVSELHTAQVDAQPSMSLADELMQ